VVYTSAFLWFGMVVAYVLAILTASFNRCQANGWATLLYCPLSFAAYHLSYGLGFLVGLRW